jgi:hypothetical protein
MGSVKVRHHIKDVALEQLLRSPQKGVYKDMFKRALKVQAAARRNLNNSPRRVNTGALRASIYVKPISVDGYPGFRIGSPLKYARFVHDGTGIYGPKGRPITPKHAKYLRFKPKGAAHFLYVKQVKGMRPNPFLKDALKAARN